MAPARFLVLGLDMISGMIDELKVLTMASQKGSERPSKNTGQLGGRLRRYARVTTTMGGLAARVAGERYLGMEIDRSKHAADLREALGGLKGPIMKVAQILSTIPDALPPE